MIIKLDILSDLTVNSRFSALASMCNCSESGRGQAVSRMGFEIWKPEKLVIKFVWPYYMYVGGCVTELVQHYLRWSVK